MPGLAGSAAVACPLPDWQAVSDASARGQGAPQLGRTLTWLILRWLTLSGALCAAAGSPVGACAAAGSPPRPPAPAPARPLAGGLARPHCSVWRRRQERRRRVSAAQQAPTSDTAGQKRCTKQKTAPASPSGGAASAPRGAGPGAAGSASIGAASPATPSSGAAGRTSGTACVAR